MTPHDHPDVDLDHGHDPGHDHHHAPLIAAGHEHLFLGANHDRNARKTWTVVAFCAAMMALEIGAGMIFNSMALLADGAHMATHAGAMLVAAMAYRFARARSADRRFSFGTGKVGDLAAFGSAVGLAATSLFIAVESIERLIHPLPIAYNQAIPVAVLGLIVNLVSAWLLHDGHDHGGHAHEHGAHDHDHHGHAHGHHDFNLRAAYVHVAADAVVSILAIGGLLLVRQFGWLWVDPVMGIVGALVIAQWSVQLMRQTGGVLLDMEPGGPLAEAIRKRVTRQGEEITDLHVWRLGPGHHAAIVCLASPAPQPAQYYREQLAGLVGLSHVTVEVASVGPDAR